MYSPIRVADTQEGNARGRNFTGEQQPAWLGASNRAEGGLPRLTTTFRADQRIMRYFAPCGHL